MYYVVSQNWNLDWRQIILRLNLSLLVIYLVLYGLGLLLRTVRYHLLLQSSRFSNLPSFWNLLLVTGVRNMLVDFLPARAGSLSYIVLLNKAFKVDLSPCLSSFTLAFLFDLLAMAPLLAVTLLGEGAKQTRHYYWLWGLALVILLVGLMIILFLGPLIKLCLRFFDRLEDRVLKHKRLKNLSQQIRTFGESFANLDLASIFWPALGLSFLIRAVKYLYLYTLLSAILQAIAGPGVDLPFWLVLLGLAASEASAGLPMSGIMGFGLYEGVLGTVLSTQGIDPSQAVLVSFAMHFLTQVVDYSLGGVALLYILLRLGLRREVQE
jgi:uncharacterized membrane protein YbhN (UPF0104 family)